MAKEKQLTPKQRAFVKEYLVDLNGAQAAIRAGYSAAVAKQIATKLFARPHVAAAIADEMKKRGERTSITADRVLREIARLAFLDIRKAFSPEGNLRPLDQLDNDTAAAIAGLEVVALTQDGESAGYLKKIKLADKIAALTLLARHLGLLQDRIKVSGDESNPLMLQSNRCEATPSPRFRIR